jgi:hypothetical protein
MVAQPTKQYRLFARSNSAKAAVRLRSPFYRFWACSYVGRVSQLSSRANSNAARSSDNHPHGAVGWALCHGSNPHRQPSLLLPTL